MLDTTRTQTFHCPTSDDLSAFYDGKLPRAQLETVAAHVEHCDTCAEKLSTHSGDSDVLVRELRHPQESEPIGPEEASRASVLAGRAGALATQIAPPPDKAARPGTLLGPYELVALIGEGGMGQVWKARHKVLGRDVAIKLIHPGRISDGVTLARFQREIQLLARLDHPNVVRAEHADIIEGTYFLVMEFVPGVSLTDHVRVNGVMPVEKACEAIRQAALGLQCAHEKGLVHRDIKPSNLLLTPDGTVKLLDLGLARAAGGPLSTDELTASGQVMGTFDYMAPEQWDDTHGVDVRADIYSLGCTAYFLLTGRAPFAESGHAGRLSKMKAHALLPPPPLKQARPDVPDALADIVGRMLAKAPADRIQTPGEVARLLETIRTGGEIMLSPPRAAGVQLSPKDESQTQIGQPQPKRRSALPWILGGVVLCMVLVGLGIGLALGFLGLWSGKARQDHVEPFAQKNDVAVGIGKPKPGVDPDVRVPPVVEKKSLVKSFLVSMREKDSDGGGEIGKTVFGVREKDSCEIEFELTENAYAYLIAFNPNGSEQLLSPNNEDEGEENVAPLALHKFRFPTDPKIHFGFTDGPGLQAFVLVVSREELPTYKGWKQKAIPIWSKVKTNGAWGTWKYDDNRLRLLEPGERIGKISPPRSALVEIGTASVGFAPHQGLAGVPWEALRRADCDNPASRIEKLLSFFEKRRGDDVEIHAWGFAVAPGAKNDKEPQ
jgi:serine/threonine protein kinase